MKNNIRLLSVGVLAGLVLFLASCSGTKVTSSWKEPEVKLDQQQKIMVLALVNDKQDALRKNIESEMTQQLRQRGYDAVPAFATYAKDDFKGMSEQKVINKIRRNGVDQVLTVVMKDKAKEKSYVNNNAFYPYPMYYGRFWPYYGMMYDRMYNPGYYTTNTRYFIEGNLYDIRDNKLLYSVQTETFDPSSAARMAVVYSQQVVKDMTKQQLITKN